MTPEASEPLACSPRRTRNHHKTMNPLLLPRWRWKRSGRPSHGNPHAQNRAAAPAQGGRSRCVGSSRPCRSVARFDKCCSVGSATSLPPPARALPPPASMSRRMIGSKKVHENTAPRVTLHAEMQISARLIHALWFACVVHVAAQVSDNSLDDYRRFALSHAGDRANGRESICRCATWLRELPCSNGPGEMWTESRGGGRQVWPGGVGPAIIRPNDSILPGYHTTLIRTKDGNEYMGVLYLVTKAEHRIRIRHWRKGPNQSREFPRRNGAAEIHDARRIGGQHDETGV